MENLKIPFAPPSISEEDIEAVVKVLRSGWITTGPVTRDFESALADYCGNERALCLNSATIGLFIALKLYGIGPGDEVITTPYTFAASANVILHCGAVPVFADINTEDASINPENIAKVFTSKTKAVISVDYGGLPVDYDGIMTVINSKKSLFRSSGNRYQDELGRALYISDAAHSLGACYKGHRVGGKIADFTVFSFHAVKNLTTAEGGAVLFGGMGTIGSDDVYKSLKLLALHGQDKDAINKYKEGNWRYDILLAGYKANMTDMQAALGLSQLGRYESDILPKRRALTKRYIELMNGVPGADFALSENDDIKSSCHLAPVLLDSADEINRDRIITGMAECGISCNVHFMPVVMLKCYKDLGYDIRDFEQSFKRYKRTITMPLYNDLPINYVDYIIEKFKSLI